MMTMMTSTKMTSIMMVVMVVSLPAAPDVTGDGFPLSATVTTTPAVEVSSTGADNHPGSDGRCDEGLPPPDQPFRVVWNHPDNCEKNNIPLHLDLYGFIFNRKRQFLGEEINTIYRTGEWPTISKTGNYSNGGLPQLFTHWDFNNTWDALGRIWQKNFTGLAIIDFEAWRAAFATNGGSLKGYRLESIKLVKQHHPEYNETLLSLEAEREFNEGARRIMTAKLAIGKALMPGGHWGYYGYPRTYGQNGYTPVHNNKISWLWRASTGLYPRIYMADPDLDESVKRSQVSHIVAEAVRVQHEFSPPNTPIYPFSNLQQGTDIFFNESHLAITLGLPAQMGAAGIVLWGSSSYYKNPWRQCSRLQEHIRTVLGPFVLNLTRFMSDCSRALCGGHGRCVHNSQDNLQGEAESQRLSALCAPLDSLFRDYHCRCYSHWGGACCQTVTTSLCRQQQQQQPDSTDAMPTSATTKAGSTAMDSGIIYMNETIIG